MKVVCFVATVGTELTIGGNPYMSRYKLDLSNYKTRKTSFLLFVATISMVKTRLVFIINYTRVYFRWKNIGRPMADGYLSLQPILGLQLSTSF